VWGVLLHSGLARSAYETLDRKPEWKELRYRGWRSCENNTKTDVIYIYIYTGRFIMYSGIKKIIIGKP